MIKRLWITRLGYYGEDSIYYVCDDCVQQYDVVLVDDLGGDYMDWDCDIYRDWETDRKSTRLNSSHSAKSRMPSSA